MRRFVFALLVTALSMPAAGQTIIQSRGVDSRVDYAALTAFGPWDDRNYDLTADDLELLADNEAELYVQIPAFFRVELRSERPRMLREGPVQYPRSSFPLFLIQHGGYLVDGNLYRSAQQQADGRWAIDFAIDEGIPEESWIQTRALEGDVRVTDPHGAAESSIEINHTDPDIVIAGSNGPGSGQKMHYSTDGGETWTQSAALPLGGTCCDPTIAYSSDGSLAYAAALGGGPLQNYFYRSADGGQTWDDLANETGADPRREIGTGTDKEFIHVDIHPTSPFKDRIYITWHEGNTMYESHSADFGHTWSAKQAVSSGTNERGIGSDITTDGAGNAYYVWAAFNSRTIWVKKSSDGGVSWGSAVEIDTTNGSFIFPVPSTEARQVFIYAAADTDRTGGPYDGSIYASWSDHDNATTSGTPANNHAVVRVAYSRDGGATWTTTTPHELGDVSTVDRYHQWIGVGPDGTVYAAYYDTRRDATRNSVDFFYSKSTDGAQTWSIPERLTTEQSPDIDNGFEFGDYNGLSAQMGKIITIFTDTRDEGDGSGNSKDVYAAGFLDGDGIFADGFESGDTSAWSSTSP